MDTEYPHKSIYLNGKEIPFDLIKTGKVSPQTEFESTTLEFIRAWTQGTPVFQASTSGSTGKPKSVEFSRDQLITSARMTLSALKLPPGGNALVCIPTRYIGGKMMLVRALINSMTLHCVEPSADPTPGIPLDTFSLASMVPLQIRLILDNGHEKHLQQLLNLLIGGSPIPIETESSLIPKLLSTKAYETFGMTESLSHFALRRLGDSKPHHFEALPGVELRLNEHGCLCVRLPYLEDEIVSTDVCQLHGAGAFEWIGRMDFAINSAGVKVHPEPLERVIESELRALGISGRALLVGLPDTKYGERVTLILESGSKVPDEDFLGYLRKKLPRYSAPGEIIYFDHLPLSQSGKVNRLSAQEIAKKMSKLTS